ncbi:hypothetical protein HMI49_10705 [Corallococcus exercitus]|uniref:Lipoprotein n=1 Tax=Corallococcus exercitus TaxID=2316736 RepID=A0A7Y4NRZ0_9BACT|nr:hypothetical protein [Corallococcus exercitus]NOK33668.1 hypothetical protein [Corallococcus exercitus]
MPMLKRSLSAFMLSACLFSLGACDSKDDPAPDAGSLVDAGSGPDAGSDAGPAEQPPPVIPGGHTLLTPSPESQTLAWPGERALHLAFVAHAGRHYDFTTEGQKHGVILYLRDAAGVMLDRLDYTTDIPFTWHWSGLTEGAVYTVELRQWPFEGEDALVFRFVDQGLDDHGDLPLTATPWGPLAQSRTGLGEHSGERDVLSFETLADHVYAIDCTFPTEGWKLYFFSLDGRYYNVVDDVSLARTQATAFKSPGGPHLVAIQNRSPAPSSETFSCLLKDKGPEDHGDMSDTATVLPLGTSSAQGELDYVEDVDAFRLGVLPGHFYRASCTLEGPTPCSVHVQNGFEQPEPQPQVTFKALASTQDVWTNGPRVAPAQWMDLPYTLQFEDLGADDHGDSAATATPLQGPPQTLQAHFTDRIDRDVFSFQAVEGQRYQFSSPWRDGQGQVLSLITTAEGFSEEAPRTHVGSRWVQDFMAPKTGTYFIELFGKVQENVGDYTFQFEALAP